MRADHPGRRPAAPGAERRPARSAIGPRPHPLGERRHHLPAQRPPRRQPRGRRRATGPTSTAALNGDVDNFADLKAADGLRMPAGDHHRRQGHPDARVPPAGRRAPTSPTPSATPWPRFEGSVAIAASAAPHPDELLLALRGSGQALYVGLAEDCYVVASEPYGLVEVTRTYLRLDGDTPADPENPNAQPRPDRRARRRARPARSRASAARPTTAPSCRSTEGDLQDGRRSRRGTSTAASTRTSCSRRSPRRPPASARRCGAGSSSGTARWRSQLGDDVLSPRVARAACERVASTGSS